MIKAKILIVEDDAIISMEISIRLKKMEYEIVGMAQSGPEAIELARIHQPDIILMDVNLDGEMDGIETAGIIKSRFDIPIIYLTAYDGNEKIERAKQTLPVAYLIKPIQTSELKAAIEIALHTAAVNFKNQQAEAELARQKLELQTIFDSVPAYIFYKDKNDRFVNVNKRLTDSIGLTKEEMIGKISSELSPDKKKSYFPDDLEVIKTGKTKTGIIESFKTHEGIKWAQTDKIPYRNEDGEIIGIIGLSKDITERKQVEEALIKSEKRYRQLVEKSMVGILIIKNNWIIFQNLECKKIIGHLPDLNMDNFFNIIFNEDQQRIKNEFENLFSGKIQTSNTKFKLFSPIEQSREIGEKWVQCITSVIQHDNKDALLINLLDITQTHKMENYIDTQEKMSSLGRVSAGIAHEIRNPLTGINTYLYSLQNLFDQDDFGGENLQSMNQILGQIRSASQMIESVVKRVIDFSKTSSPHFHLTDLNKAVKEAIDLTSTSLKKADITLQVSLTEDSLDCFADPFQLKQVVLNLINNATESLEQIQTEKIIEIDTARNDDSIIISIADSGPGVKAEHQKKIFDPFYSSREDGSGIGLSIVHRIVTDHGGYVKVARNSHGGATFKIKLPIDKRKIR